MTALPPMQTATNRHLSALLEDIDSQPLGAAARKHGRSSLRARAQQPGSTSRDIPADEKQMETHPQAKKSFAPLEIYSKTLMFAPI